MHVREIRLRRGRDFHLAAVGDFLESNRVNSGRQMWATGRWVDARAGQPQHWPRKFGDRWIRPAIEQSHNLPRRTKYRLRQRRRLERVDDLLRRHLIARRLNRLSEQHRLSENDQRGGKHQFFLSHRGPPLVLRGRILSESEPPAVVGG